MARQLPGFVVMCWAVAFLMGYADPRARADVPPKACDMYECKTVFGYWEGSATAAWGVHDTVTGVASDDGYESIFTPKSDEKKPRNDTMTSVRHWVYSACVPSCGLDANNKWQATQEVSLDASAKGMTAAETTRKPCTDNKAKGPTVPNPTNKNKDGNKPPGWKDDE